MLCCSCWVTICNSYGSENNTLVVKYHSAWLCSPTLSRVPAGHDMTDTSKSTRDCNVTFWRCINNSAGFQSLFGSIVANALLTPLLSSTRAAHERYSMPLDRRALGDVTVIVGACRPGLLEASCISYIGSAILPSVT